MGSIQDFERCLHGKEAPCSAACPFRINVRELVGKLARGSFGPAYNLYRSAVAFPELVSRLCTAPYQTVCTKMLAMSALERSAIAFSRSWEPVKFTLPPEKERCHCRQESRCFGLRASSGGKSVYSDDF